ncbi:PD-(D/E)XK nuclease family protein [Campylobacter sp.]|uniref:PD-(D/E)XK nuclease family protein n=1 Tax=Campylobacter sp. TaxID=205 RepID=UPI003FA10B1F
MHNLDKLFVFTNSRKIREFNASFNDEILPKSLSIAEFYKKVLFVKDRFEIDSTYALVLMNRACASVKEANSVLKIPTEFFEFLKNNDYLFSFFKELAISKKSIGEIKFNDIYADFEEHLSILEVVLKKYESLLEHEKFYDDITLPKIYTINEDYVKKFSEISLHIDGILSEFEWEVLEKISRITTLKIIFQTSIFNKKLADKIKQISNLSELDTYKKYELNLKTNELVCLEEISKFEPVLVREFTTRSLQCAYVMAKASEFVRDGIKPENIAVILPDESFSEILRLHDSGKIFNYAMGESFKSTKFYEILFYITRAINEEANPIFDQSKLESYEEFGFILSEFGVNEELFNKFKSSYFEPCEFARFKELVDEIFALSDEVRSEEKLNLEFFRIENLCRYFKFSLKQLCEIFLLNIARLSIDDVGGGKISVMGMLESRGMKFDGVIVVDFNDNFIPTRSTNEMFLNSKVRQKAGLISYLERENLQRFYYESLINNAKKVAISCCVNEESIPSRFLKNFRTIKDKNFSDEAYLKLFLKGNASLNLSDDEIVLEHDFFAKELSFSTLNLFLTCPRKYYYAKIAGIRPAKGIATEPGSKQGNSVHNALYEYYMSDFYIQNNIFDLSVFKKMLAKQALSPLELEIWIQKFKDYEKFENNRLNAGFKVLECEKEVKRDFCGVQIYGYIDRIDAGPDGEPFILDYKTGDANANSLQLAFYEALYGSDAKSAYYALKNEPTLVSSKKSIDDLGAEIENLKNINKTKINFEKKSSACKFCEYAILCWREL